MRGEGKEITIKDLRTSEQAVRLFIPCYVDQLAPAVAQAAVDLLARLDIAWSYPAAQTCCGQLSYNAGDWPAARKLMRHFFEVFPGPGPVLCPGPACVRMVRRSYTQLAETRRETAEVTRLSSQVVDLSEYLHSLGPFPFPLAWSGRVFLHQSCAARDLGFLPTYQRLLAQVKGLELCTLPEAYSCCGFGGLFSLKQKELSQVIGWRYLQAVLGLKPQVLISPDVGCLLHLRGIAAAQTIQLPMWHIAEFLVGAAQEAR